MTLRPTYTIGLIVLIALPVLGQSINMMSSSFSGGPNGMRGSATFSIGMRSMPAPRNAPYSGQEVAERKQTLVDGTNITRQMPRGGKTWRDTQGRVRTEGNRMGGGMLTSNGDPAFVEISDPVGGYMYVLDNVNHVAHRVQFGAGTERPAPMARPAAANAPGVTGYPAGNPAMVSEGLSAGMVGSMASGGGGGGGGGRVVGGIIGVMPSPGIGNRQRPDVATEDLGTKMIDGVLVSGTRRTTTIPEGAQGNDRPMKTTSETWVSKELQLTLLTIDYSPMNGTATTKIENFSTAEPDPALFMVPSNYSVVDEKETFTIKWGDQ